MTIAPDPYQKAMNAGHAAAWDREWKKAVESYQQALQIKPNDSMALNSLGLAYFELREFGEALESYERASQAAPQDPTPVEKMAVIYERQGGSQMAVELFLQAADMYLEAHDTEKAIENWVRVTIQQPDQVVARSRLAQVYEQLGRKAEAVTEHLVLASAHQQAGDLAQAIQSAEQAARISPESREAQQALQMLRSNEKLPLPVKPREDSLPEQRFQTRKLPDLPPRIQDPVAAASQRALEALAGLLFEETASNNNDTPRRQELAALARGTGPLNPQNTNRNRRQLFLRQAIDSQSQKRLPAAATDLEHALDLGLDHPAVHFDLGYLLFEKDPEKALKYLQKSAHSPDFILASYLLMGRIHSSLSQHEAAAIAFIQALRRAEIETIPMEQAADLDQLYDPVIASVADRKDDDYYQNISKVVSDLLFRPDWRSAIAAYRTQLLPAGTTVAAPLAGPLLESGGSQVIETMQSIQSLANQDKLRTAMEEAYDALVAAPAYLPIQVQIGDILLAQGRLHEALDKFLLISELYSLRGETAQAISLLSRISQVAPMDTTVRNRLISSLEEQSRYDEAVREALELSDVYYQLADLEMSRQACDNALRLARLLPSSPEWQQKVLRRLADIDVQRLDLRQAIRDYEAILDLEPGDTASRGQLIDLHFRLGQSEAAIQEVNRCAAILEDNGQRHTAIQFVQALADEKLENLELPEILAGLYHRNGQQETAVNILDALAEKRFSSGDHEGACQALQRIIALNPPNVDLYQQALEEIAKMR